MCWEEDKGQRGRGIKDDVRVLGITHPALFLHSFMSTGMANGDSRHRAPSAAPSGLPNVSPMSVAAPWSSLLFGMSLDN